MAMAMTLAPILLATSALAAYPSYESRVFNQSLDHFDPTSTATWSHRYLFRDTEWGKPHDGQGLANGCPGPILMYTGNEGPITAFWGSNGFMVEYLAPKWGAMLVFPEERYYGESLPFGRASFSAQNLRYLTTEQVLEDYVAIVDHLRATIDGAASCPVLAFGGSYGGTLTTFLRAKYPATVIGGLAASAPIGYYDKQAWAAHGVSEFTWGDIVTRDYADAEPRCLDAITAAMTAIEAAPKAELVKAFGVCDAAGLGPTAPTNLFSYALESQAQLDYPYPVGDLPAWPVNASCRALVGALDAGTRGGHQARLPSPLIAAAANITAAVLGRPSGGGW
jgi:pimeloyl-ACP methyl ester carboxylesterase